MSDDDLDSKLRRIDEELAASEVPSRDRWHHAITRLSDELGIAIGLGSPGGLLTSEGIAIAERAAEYFDREYGRPKVQQGPLGTTPLLIKAEAFAIEVPVIVGTPELDPVRWISGLTPQMKAGFSQSDWDRIEDVLKESYRVIYQVADYQGTLTNGKHGQEATDFLVASLRDRDDMVPNLLRRNTNHAMLHAQQSVEKMLKGTAVAAGIATTAQLRKKSHSIADLFDLVCDRYPELACVGSDIAHLSSFTMTDVRYKASPYPLTDAYEITWAALRVLAALVKAFSGMPSRDILSNDKG